MPSLDDAIGGVTTDPLDAAIDGVDQGNARLRTSLYGAVKQNPDEAARALQLSRKTGLPAPIVQRNLPQVEQRTTLDDLDAAIDKNSALAGKMSDPGFAALGHDDVDTLAEIEKRARKYGEIKASRGPQASFSSVVAGQLGVLPNTFDRIREGLRLEFADLFGLDEMAADAQKKRARTDFRESLTTPEFDSTLGRWVYGGAANIQRVAPSIAAGIATRNPYIGLAGMGAQVQPETYGKYRARGATPGEAAAGSGIETGIEIGTEMLPMGFLVDKFGKAGAKDFIAGYLGRELPTELVAEISQGAVDTAIANPNKTWGEYAAELPDTIGQTVVSTLMMSGGLTAVNEAARRLAPQQDQADTATQHADALAQAAQLAAASKLRMRDPQTFQEFAEAVDPGAELYLDARTLQQAGIDVAALAQASPSVAAQLEQALATGDDLIIPKAEYLTSIAGTDLDPVLTPHLRASEEALSLAEIPAAEEQARMFQAAAAKVMEEKIADEAFTSSAKAVETKLFDELKSTGRFTDDVNTAYATLMRDFFVATSARLGITPQEMFARYPIRVAAESGKGGQRMEQGGTYPSLPVGMQTQEQMLARGADGQLTKAWERYIDVSKIDGLEPTPAASDDVGYVKGRTIERPIEVVYDAAEDKYVLYGGNHRVTQAKLNGDGYIRAWVQPDKGRIGKDATTSPARANLAQSPAPNPLQRFAQSVKQALGLRAQPAEPVADGVAPLDMGQFFQGEAAADQTETAEFKAWSEGAPVVAADELGQYDGGPAVFRLYHGTTGDFDTFDRERANPESDLGAGFYFTNNPDDVSANYAGEGPDLTQRIQLLAERIAGETDRGYDDPEVIAEAKEQLSVQHGGMAMPAFVKMQTPFVIGGDNETQLTYEQPYDEETDDYGEETGTLVDFIVALRNVAEQYNDGSVEEAIDAVMQKATDYGQIGASELIQTIKEAEEFSYYTNDEGTLVSSEIIRQAFEEAGFDGFVDYTVNQKFGSEKRIGKPMAGMAEDTVHAVAFEPTQIKSAIGNRGTFDPNDPNILNQGQGSNRAEISFAKDITSQPSVITLFKNADLSSFLHEMGHFQLEVLANIASRPDAPAEIVQDLDAVFKWFGITGTEQTVGGETAGALGQGAVESDAFRAWFGDSKVVDADGRPLVVYHYSDAKDIKAFSGSGMFGQGPIYFNADPKAAKKAARGKKAEYPVYLRMENPVNTPETALPWHKVDDGIWVAEAKRNGNDGVYVKDEGGVSIAVFNPEQIKSAIGNRGTFDPNDPNILNQGDDATPKPTSLPPGRTPLEVWQAMSLEEKRPYHEQFARGFEAYLFEGKAPSAELTGLFARFRAWLINVYKSVKALNVEINDEIRGVFDRMLATDEAIKQAEAARGYAPLFPDDAELQALGAQATEDAVSELQRRGLRDMRWLSNARGRILKQLQADAKAKRQAVEDEVRAEVRALPVYAAQRFLRYGEIDGEQVEGAKLDLAALKEMYGEEANAPWRYLPTGKAGLAGNEGLPPDVVAEMFGFTSGDQLVREILATEPESQMIEGMTDQRVLERYGDIASPDTLARAVDEAIHNEARARFVATELQAVTKAAGPVRAITAAAKAFAETLVARKKVKDIKPRQHAAAETRAAKAAEKAMAEGDTLAAASEKRNQLVQNYATRVSYDALTEIDKAVKYLRKFDSEGARKSLDVDYLDQIDALLERFDLRASVSNKDAAKRASLIAWVESQREQGFEPDIPPELVSEAMRKPYRELTLEELRGLIDMVKQIEHLGRLKQKLLTAADERAFDAVVATIRDSITANAKGVRDLRTRNTTGAMLADAGNRFLAMHRKMASVSREMDGFVDGGPMWDYFIRSMNAAGDRETTHRAEATRKLYDLVKPLLAQGKMGGKGQYFEELGASFNREERIAIALNLGNAGNMQRLLDGEGWTMTRLKPLLDTITPEEADFVQAVWDFFESYRPEIAAKERRIYGKEPNWVEPQPVVLGGKTLKGGYYPIKYDTARSGRAEAFADAETAKQQMRGAFTSATTRRSFTKARAEEVTGRPLVYSFTGLYQGTNEVIHDLTWHEWLIDANRLLRAVDAPMRLHYGAETVGLFKAAIQDIAAGDVPAQNVFERGLNHVRTGATIAGLGWNLMTSLLQPIGLTQSMVRIGPGWVTKGLGQWMKAPLATVEEIKGKSAMMVDRARTMQREINEIQNQVRGSQLDPVRSTFFVLIQKMQMVADVPTWLGAYEKHIAAGEAETRAIALADQAVLDAQGGGQIKDLSQIQRGHPALKLFTNFYSFFNVAYNLGVEKTKQKIKKPTLYPSLALDYLLLYVLPAALVTVMKEALLGGGDDEDELVDKIIADQISYLLGLMVGTREITAAVQKAAGVEQFKGSYGGPAGLRLFQELDKLGQQVGQGEADMALFKAANNAAGIVFHYPSGQVNRSAEGVAAMLEGKTENPAALIVGPPKD